jgi:hypothetical protein
LDAIEKEILQVKVCFVCRASCLDGLPKVIYPLIFFFESPKCPSFAVIAIVIVIGVVVDVARCIEFSLPISSPVRIASRLMLHSPPTSATQLLVALPRRVLFIAHFVFFFLSFQVCDCSVVYTDSFQPICLSL